MEEALQSAAFLVAALVDRRFGLKGAMSAELKDSLSVLRRELDDLGLLAEYRRQDGTLAAWDASADAYSREVLGRASAKDAGTSTELEHRVILEGRY